MSPINGSGADPDKIIAAVDRGRQVIDSIL
jgi:hypothetical protein